MDTDFKIYDEINAPEAARKPLADAKAGFGLIPNLEGVMAEAPALLATYIAGWDLFDTTSFTPIERQVVYQTANFENECTYCVPWHTYLSKQSGMKPEDVEALRTGAVLSDPKLQALRVFARQLIHNRGNVSQADLDTFFAAGYTKQQALEVVLGLAIKTMSNFTNSIAGTPLDAPVQNLAWEKPTIPMRAPNAAEAA